MSPVTRFYAMVSEKKTYKSRHRSTEHPKSSKNHVQFPQNREEKQDSKEQLKGSKLLQRTRTFIKYPTNLGAKLR